MGFTSFDDFLAKATNVGAATALQTFHCEWNKVTGGTLYTAGRWYDMNLTYGIPPLGTYGELTQNAGPWNSANAWQLNTQWTYTPATPVGSFVRAGTGGGKLTQTAMQGSLVNGRTYIVVWNLTAISGGSITVSLNGANGLARSVAGTFAEVITVGAGSGGLVFDASASGVTATIAGSATIPTGVSVFEDGGATQILAANNTIGAMYHGGNVSPMTKHIFNAGIMSNIATAAPGTWLLCDFVMVYPGIDLNNTSTQTLANNVSLPRYTTGAGLRSYLVVTTTYPATLGPYAAGSLAISYTNQAGVAGQSLGFAVGNSSGAIVGQIAHSGFNEGNRGPFLPLAAGDTGMRSVQSITLSSATDNPYRVFPNTICLGALVMAKPLMALPMAQISTMSERDLMYQLPSLPQVQDGAYLGWLYYAGAATATSANFSGYIDVAWG